MCSVFDLMDDAVISVRENIENFLDGVSVDVPAPDCTIFAVEQLVLSDNSYLERCLQVTTTSYDNVQTDISDSLQSVDALEANQDNQENFINNNFDSNHNLDIQNDLSESISKLSTTLTVLQPDIHVQLQFLRTYLQNESEQLIEIDSYLRQKLNSNSFENEFDKINLVDNSSVLEDIWNNLQIIHKSGEIDKDPNVGKINRVFNEMINKNYTDKPQEMELNSIINTLATDINKKLNINNKHSDNNTIDVTREDVSIENKLILPTDNPVLAISNENKLNKDRMEGNVSTETKDTNNLLFKPEKTNNLLLNNAVETLIKPEAIEDKNKDDLFSVLDDFGSDMKSKESSLSPPDQKVKNIFEEYKFSEAIMNKYFGNPKYVIDDLSFNDENDNEDIDEFDDLFSNIN